MCLNSNVIIVTVFMLCITYMIYTRYLFTFCAHGKIHNDYFVGGQLHVHYQDMCNDVFRISDSPNLYKYSLKLFHKIFSEEEFSKVDYAHFKQWFQKTSYYSKEIELRTLKYVHIVFYIVTLYILIVKIPRMVINLILLVVDKVLFVLFLLFLFEAVLNFSDLNMNVSYFRMIETIYHFFSRVGYSMG